MVKVGKSEEHITDEMLYDKEATLNLCGIKDTNIEKYETGYFCDKHSFFYKTNKPIAKDELKLILKRLGKEGKVTLIDDLEDVDLLRLSASMKIAVCEEKEDDFIISMPEEKVKTKKRKDLLVIS